MPILTHALVKHLSQLQLKSYRNFEKEFIIEGAKLIEECLSSGWEVTRIITSDPNQASFSMPDILTYVCDEAAIKKISTHSTPPSVLASVKIRPTELKQLMSGQQFILCIDGVADPGNLGTIIRTADWFGVKSILLSENSVDLYNEKVVRSTMGSLFHPRIYQSKDIVSDIESLKKSGYKIITTSVNEGKAELPNDNFCLMLGSESHGVRHKLEDRADSSYHIPGYGQAESLNLAVSTGIILYDLKEIKKLI